MWRLQAEEAIHQIFKKGAWHSTRSYRPSFVVQRFKYCNRIRLFAALATNSNSCASGTVSIGEALRYIVTTLQMWLWPAERDARLLLMAHSIL
jgi:hypothetical protein